MRAVKNPTGEEIKEKLEDIFDVDFRLWTPNECYVLSLYGKPTVHLQWGMEVAEGYENRYHLSIYPTETAKSVYAPYKPDDLKTVIRVLRNYIPVRTAPRQQSLKI